MKKKLLSFILCLFFFLLLLFPDAVQAGAKEGLYLWYSTMIPILFPFILISNLLLATDSIRYFTYPVLPLLKWFPNLNPSYFYALIFGWFCGYPMGGKTVADLLRSGKITSREANFLLPAANQASPMFLMGYLGIHIFQNTYTFGQILFFVYAPVIVYFLLGLFFLSLFPDKKNFSHFPNSFSGFPLSASSLKEKNSTSLSMEHTIFSSFQIIVNIGVYMMVFTILMRLCLLLLPNQNFLSILTGFLEMSTGISWLNSLSFLPSVIKTSLILSAASFGGLCTCAQTYSVTEGLELSLPYYIIGKLFLGSCTFVTAWFLL